MKRTDLWRIHTFLRRADELCANWDDFIHRRYSPDGADSQHRAKALYVDFRFFIARKEPVNIARMMRLLRPRFKRAAVHRFLADLQRDWDRGDRGRYPGVTNLERFIAARFNADYFHCDPKRDRQAADLVLALDDDAARQVIVAAIGYRVELLRSLSDALAPFRREVQEFWLP